MRASSSPRDGSLASRDEASTSFVSSGTSLETTFEPGPQKEPEPRSNHPESVDTSILYLCTVLGAQRFNDSRRESCNFSMPDQVLSIAPSTERPLTELYKRSIVLLCNLIINNHRSIFFGSQPFLCIFQSKKTHVNFIFSLSLQTCPSFLLKTLQILQQAKQISSTCSVTLESFTSLLSSAY
jgi:hypothetical protein